MVVLAGLAAACDDGGGDASPQTTADLGIESTTSSVPVRPDDGRLTIGLLLPLSGDHQQLGEDLRQAATSALDSINAAGGVRGQQIVTVDADEGDTPEEASAAVEELLDGNVDAVIGPASSISALATLDLLLAANVLTCSPTATALALDDYPNRSLFFRTAPSDSLQAAALAGAAQTTGQRSVALVWVDDVYGRPFASAVGDSLAQEMNVISRAPFTADSDLDDVATSVVDERPGVIIVVADGELGTRMLSALADAVAEANAPDPVMTGPPNILVNDAMRELSSDARERIAELPEEFRTRIMGLAPSSTGSEEIPGAFATNAFDCATLIALAAEEVGPDDTVAMEARLPQLTTSGNQCRDFATCALGLGNSLNVDYEGPAGPVDIGTDGDPVRSRFDVFEYTAEGDDESTRQLVYPR